MAFRRELLATGVALNAHRSRSGVDSGRHASPGAGDGAASYQRPGGGARDGVLRRTRAALTVLRPETQAHVLRDESRPVHDVVRAGGGLGRRRSDRPVGRRLRGSGAGGGENWVDSAGLSARASRARARQRAAARRGLWLQSGVSVIPVVIWVSALRVPAHGCTEQGL